MKKQKSNKFRKYLDKLVSFFYYSGLVIIVYFILKLWYRWLRIDPDFLNFTTGIAQLLTIVAFLGIQTEPSIKAKLSFKVLLIEGHIKQKLKKFTWTVIIAGFIYFLLYLSANQIATIYRKNGVSLMEAGDYSRAIWNFQQALNLSGGDARTYYDIANAEESLNNYDLAIENYHLSIELDDSFWPAYNNLGRLYLEARDDKDTALPILLSGYRSASTKIGKATISKNIGQVYLQMNLFNSSLEELSQAERSFNELLSSNESVEIYLAEIHLLKAKVYKRLDMAAKSMREWQDSLGYSLSVSESQLCNQEDKRTPPDCLNAFIWVTEAKEVLSYQ